MATPEEVRARNVRRDIFARHGIPEGTPDDEAISLIEQKAARDGAGASAWANPDERAAGREAYASVGKTPDEVQKRWEDSIYLMDPETARFRQNYGRDKEFLQRMSSRDEMSPSVSAWTGPSNNPAALGQIRTQNALAAWDQTNNNPLYRDSWSSSGWEEHEGMLPMVANLTGNPDLAIGRALLAGNVPYDFLAMQGSGESGSAGDSYKTAMGLQRAIYQNRLDSGAPVLDLPSSAAPDERAARLAELQGQVTAGGVPDSGERWARTGFLPPPVVRDIGDNILATLDGTQFIPGIPAVKGAASVAKGLTKGAIGHAARDMAADAAMSSAIAGGFSQQPERTWGQYLGFSAESPDAATVKGPQEVGMANEARRQTYDRTLGGASVSTADDEAYKRLQAAGKAPYRNR